MKLNKKAIKVAMAERELNQKQLADLAGIQEATLSCILTGKSNCRPETWDKLAKALEVALLDVVEIN